jgi:hypothetical protein
MKRPRKSAKKSRRLKVIRLWNYPEALRAVPYLRSVLDALRNHYLDSLRHRLTIERLSAKKADRNTLIALEDARKDLDRAQDAFKESHRELRKIDVFLLDPLEGIALIPCQKGEELAWMVFEQFDKDGFVGWRWHKDEFELRRPLTDLAEPRALPPSAETAAAEA